MNVRLFEAIADLLIPANTDMPSASQAAAGGTGLAEVLKFRPELKPVLENILAQCEGKAPQQALDSLDATAFAALAEIVASAYFMNERVREKLRYQGQDAKAIIPEQIEQALLQPVVERGAIYRDTK
jgi:hypothetical protein